MGARMNALTHISHLRGQAFWRAADETLPPVAQCCPMCGQRRVMTSDALTIAFEVAEQVYGYSPDELKGRALGRTPRITEARSLIVWAARSLGKGMSYTEIGRLMDGRDHGSIINLHQKAISRRLCDSEFAGHCRAVVRAYSKPKDQIDGE